MKKIVLLFWLIAGTFVQAQNIVGYWKIDGPEPCNETLSSFLFEEDGTFVYFTDSRYLIKSLEAMRGEYKVEDGKLILIIKEMHIFRDYIICAGGPPYVWDWESCGGTSEVRQLAAGPFSFRIEKDRIPVKAYDEGEMTDILRIDSMVFYRREDADSYPRW